MFEEAEAPDGVTPKRGSKRVSLRADIFARKAGYAKTGVTVLDLSTTGCRLELPERVAVGETLWVTFDGLKPIEARVAWLDGGTAGLSFVVPIHPAVFDALVSKMKN
jgi:hypothetical protein